MRVLVALESCALPKYAERRQLILNTWAQQLPPWCEFKVCDGPTLGVDDDYGALRDKTRAICLYALTHGYDGLFIADDDIYVRCEHLTIPSCDYGGYVMPREVHKRHEQTPYCAGSFYWLSRRAFTIVAVAPYTDTLAEDQWVGKVMEQHEIKPKEIPGVVLAPCRCGVCKPAPVPEDWFVYVIDGNRPWTREQFLALTK